METNSENKTTVTIHNLMILDRSGSMDSIRKYALDSLNETIQTAKMAQTKNPLAKQTVSLVTFSGQGMSGVDLLRDRLPADQTPEVGSEEYVPCGCTPLYDAMGFGITHMLKTIAPEDVVLVTIITDGMENSSQVYNVSSVRELVEDCRKKGWTFAYIGANQDAVEVARSMSINNALDYCATEEGASEMKRTLSDSRMAFSLRAMSRKDIEDVDDFFKR